ncbi:MAG TPA: AraC family transcriptional regulator [Bryobacteraceae bacterium]|jgi:AraC-like DNA-binding protein|nr:AraC family transcriptional regulator [Bryobacteraceae bacterium]
MAGLELQAANRRMTCLLSALAKEGLHPTAIEGVQLMRASQPIPRSQVLYEPGIVIVGQGRKRGYLGDRVFTYDAHNYLVLSVPLPFECETEASPQKPVLAVSIRVDLAMLSELLMKMDGPRAAADPAVPQGIYSTTLDLKLSEATVRLLECLAAPADIRILGPQIVREITYRVLCGEQGSALRAAAALHSRFGQVNRTVQRIHSDYAREITVEELAETAGMSVSAFHQNFKAVTSTSPLQYLKTIRLHKARMLMVHEGLRAGMAARSVGYESSSQFSREFRRLFGASPLEETERVRRILGVAEPVIMAME